MNEHDIMKAMDGVEEDILSTYTDFKPKKGGKLKRVIRTTAIALALLVFAIPVGAYSYRQLMHRDSVDMYFENADKLETSGKVENQVIENEHMRITVDTLLSDGYSAMAVITTDIFDDYGRNYIEHSHYLNFRNPDTGEIIYPSGFGVMDDSVEQLKNDTIRSYQMIALSDMDIDISCDYEMIFFGGNMTEADNPSDCALAAKVNFTKNVDTVTLKGTNGKEVTLSQFELIYEESNMDELPETMYLIRNDGTKEETDSTKMTGMGLDEYSILFFGKFIELDEYKGVEINGVQYVK